jgi:hypothetical protein
MVHPLAICDYCGERWCKDCCETLGWTEESHSHRYVRTTVEAYGKVHIYSCPIAKEMYFDYDVKPFRLRKVL